MKYFRIHTIRLTAAEVAVAESLGIGVENYAAKILKVQRSNSYWWRFWAWFFEAPSWHDYRRLS